MAAAPSRDFPQRLREHEEQRHAGILLVESPSLRSTLPPGWRAEDLLRSGGGTRGFVTLEQAAVAMSESEDDVLDLVHRGLLLAELRGATLFVQPAVVGVTRVVRRDAS